MISQNTEELNISGSRYFNGGLKRGIKFRMNKYFGTIKEK